MIRENLVAFCLLTSALGLVACSSTRGQASANFAAGTGSGQATPAGATQEGHVTITDDHLVIDDHILFEHNSAKIKSESFEILNDIVKVMQGHPEIKALHVIGHTDASGGDEFNQNLSEERAKSVYEYLKAHGVTQPIDHRGVGEAQPLCQADTPECHEKNRRVEFKIEKKM